jgi:intracellular sulfur oxidation DsrE/DsrF family protein
MRIVVQIADLARAAQSIASLANLAAGLRDAEIEAVFHQDAVEAVLRGSPYEETIRGLLGRVKIVACAAALRARGRSPQDLIDGVGVVEVGVVELAKRASEGWLYLRL